MKTIPRTERQRRRRQLALQALAGERPVMPSDLQRVAPSLTSGEASLLVSLANLLGLAPTVVDEPDDP